LTAKIDNANSSLGLPQNPNNLLFGESATFHSCAPMSGTLTFQWHTFRGEGQAKTKLVLLPEREAIRRDIPYTSWQDFLKMEAENGNEVALAVLRSPQGNGRAGTGPGAKAPVKNWMERGNEYAAKTTLRAEYAEKERKLQERDDIDISHQGKIRLLAFLHIEQIAAEAPRRWRGAWRGQTPY
jgi:hypothetical protein